MDSRDYFVVFIRQQQQPWRFSQHLRHPQLRSRHPDFYSVRVQAKCQENACSKVKNWLFFSFKMNGKFADIPSLLGDWLCLATTQMHQWSTQLQQLWPPNWVSLPLMFANYSIVNRTILIWLLSHSNQQWTKGMQSFPSRLTDFNSWRSLKMYEERFLIYLLRFLKWVVDTIVA